MRNIPNTIVKIKKTQNVQELVELYSNSDIFVNFTYQDNYPTVNLESISCGTPIITYNTGGSVESVTSNTGYIVEKGNVEQVYKTILSHFEKHDRSVDFSTERLEFDKKKMYSKYIDLYERVINDEV